jgi:hypothetical protein
LEYQESVPYTDLLTFGQSPFCHPRSVRVVVPELLFQDGEGDEIARAARLLICVDNLRANLGK